MPYTITDIEVALRTLFSGATITTLRDGAVAVPFFVDRPSPEEHPELPMPALQLEFMTIEPARHLDESEDEYQVGEDLVADPPTSTMRKNRGWRTLHFRLHAFNEDDASADRQLMLWVETRRHPAFTLEVSPGVYVECRSTPMIKADTVVGDSFEYHKVWPLEVDAFLEDAAGDTEVKRVKDVALTFSVVKTGFREPQGGLAQDQILAEGGVIANPSQRSVSTPLDANNNPSSAEGAVKHTDRKMIFTDTTVTFQ